MPVRMMRCVLVLSNGMTREGSGMSADFVSSDEVHGCDGVEDTKLSDLIHNLQTKLGRIV